MAEGSSRPAAGRIMSLRFAATLLVSATLLFACQPMIARMTVPLLGGAPAVWIICSLCFQGLLLAGYAYAHLVAARFTPRVQVGLQLVLVAAALAVMPIAVDPAWARTLTEREPALGLVVLILRVVGLPFFVLSTTSPLLQRWFADLGERDPYQSLARGILYGLALGLGTFVVARLGASLQLDPKLMVAVAFGVPVLVSFAWANRPVRFAVALGAVLLAGTTHGTRGGVTLHQERSFFGVLRVTEDHTERFRLLVFGDTMHGQESVLPERRSIPLAYYHATGPAGDVLGPLPRALAAHPEDAPAHEPAGDDALLPRRVGVVGLGVGALAAYARPGDTWTFFEINGGVVSVARRWFTFLGAVPEGARVSVEVGDGRLLLRDGDADRFDVLVLDAFSSDAIPVHLVTREALQIYRRALTPGGILLAHVSNRHVKRQPIFAALAAETDLVAIGREDLALTPALEAEGKSASEWVVLTTSALAISRITGRSPGWTALHADPSRRIWTDDYADVLGALRF
jgi:SAM-dependent methyltransferase